MERKDYFQLWNVQSDSFRTINFRQKKLSADFQHILDLCCRIFGQNTMEKLNMFVVLKLSNMLQFFFVWAS